MSLKITKLVVSNRTAVQSDLTIICYHSLTNVVTPVALSPFCHFVTSFSPFFSLLYHVLAPLYSQFFPSSVLFLFPYTLSVFSIPILHPPHSSFLSPLYLSLSLDGFRLLSWWGWWPVWRLGCLVSCVIRADVARRGRSELSASASPRVTFHGQLVSEQRHARRLSASLIVKINGNQSPHSTLHSPFAPFTSLLPTLTLSSPCLSLLPLYLSEFSPDVLLQLFGKWLLSGNMLSDCSALSLLHTLCHICCAKII